MKKDIIIGSLALIAAAALLSHFTARAQTTSAPYQWSVSPSTTIANCMVVPNQTTFCPTGDGHINVSPNGAAFVCAANCGVAANVVTSWNGQTGAVVYTPPPPPVTSVNNKTGAVILSLQ